MDQEFSLFDYLPNEILAKILNYSQEKECNLEIRLVNYKMLIIYDEFAPKKCKSILIKKDYKSPPNLPYKWGYSAEKFIPPKEILDRTYSLNLGYDNIGYEKAVTLFEALKGNSTLSSLNLGGNNIGTEGAFVISKFLEVNSTLSSLNLVTNNIGYEGAVALADALKINSTLSSLNLENNNIGSEGVFALSKALEVNSTLFFLNLVGNIRQGET